MVLSNGSKAARNQQSISNRTNVCGGMKKSGLAPSIGYFIQSNPRQLRTAQTIPKECVISTVIPTQRYGYRATHGGNMG